MRSAIYRFVIKQNYVDLLMSMEFETKKIKELAKTSGMDYCNLTRVMQEFRLEGIIKMVPENNPMNEAYILSLTEKGKKVLSLLNEIKKIVQTNDSIESTQEE